MNDNTTPDDGIPSDEGRVSDKLKLLDLFSGIGGFSLGLERSDAFETVAFCEIDPFCQKVLAKNWPKVPCYDDVRTITAERLAADGITVDAICGGFPCQDISVAGKGAGLAGERSGLWREYARLIGELRPQYVIVENVSALLGRGLGVVLGDLAALGFDAEWHCIPASAVGAPHRRDRLWVMAYSNGMRELQPQGSEQDKRGWVGDEGETLADAHNGLCDRQEDKIRSRWNVVRSGGEDASDSMRSRSEGHWDCTSRIAQAYATFGSSCWWEVEPDVGRVADGIPDRAHRIKALGNAVVPQIPELIGRAIKARMDQAS